MRFQDGKKYWLTHPDGSRVLVTAQLCGDDEIELYNRRLDFLLWAGGESLANIEVEEA